MNLEVENQNLQDILIKTLKEMIEATYKSPQDCQSRLRELVIETVVFLERKPF